MDYAKSVFNDNIKHQIGGKRWMVISNLKKIFVQNLDFDTPKSFKSNECAHIYHSCFQVFGK